MGSIAQAGEVRVAVAANFAAPMQALAQSFQQTSGHSVATSVGATGQLYAQIKNGAPFDILLAADVSTPLRLEQEGATVAGTRVTYAIGKVVLWSKNPRLIDNQGQILRTGAFDKIAIANPRLAPYGTAAMQVLQNMGVVSSVRPKMVEAANIAQAYQFVATQNATLGFVALSQVSANGILREGSVWHIPSHLYSPVRQDAVLLKASQHNPAAFAFYQFLKTDTARTLINSWGYETPE